MTFSGFFDQLGDLDWVGVLAGTGALFVLGFLWYGPIFGKAWARANDVEYDRAPSGMGGSIALSVVYYFAFNIGISYMSPLDDIEDALVGALIIGVLLIGPVLMSGVAWLRHRPMRWVIDAAHWFVAAAVALYVQGLLA